MIIRNTIEPGDLGYITYLHGILYSRECGFDTTFEPYVAIPLSNFIIENNPRSGIWIVEGSGKVQGCMFVVCIDADTAQLRWFLLEPSMRGKGIGKRILEEGIRFCKEKRYKSIILWTVHLMEAAIHLYKKYGFELKEEKEHTVWGRELIEQKFELKI